MVAFLGIHLAAFGMGVIVAVVSKGIEGGPEVFSQVHTNPTVTYSLEMQITLIMATLLWLVKYSIQML